jgi:TRAP-type C4-dicarboxylate transport system permease small subunit
MQEENEPSGKVLAAIIVVLFFGYVILMGWLGYDWNNLCLFTIAVGAIGPFSGRIFNWVYRTRNK